MAYLSVAPTFNFRVSEHNNSKKFTHFDGGTSNSVKCGQARQNKKDVFILLKPNQNYYILLVSPWSWTTSQGGRDLKIDM
jgi:hypothetical protein